MLTIVLYTLFILACFILIVAVLLQPGKSGAGDLFTSSVSSTAFGPRGTQTVLAKITVVAAIVFMLGALLIGLGLGGPSSVMQGVTAPEPAATPAAQTTPQTEGAPAASPQSEGAATTPATGASPAAGDAPATGAASPQTQASPAR